MSNDDKKDGQFVMNDAEATAFLIIFQYCEDELDKIMKKSLDENDKDHFFWDAAFSFLSPCLDTLRSLKSDIYRNL